MNSNRNTRVLVIDDQEAMREFLTFLLETEGYDVHAANNGETGLKLIKSWKPHVTLLDRMMPGMSGDVVLEKVREDPDIQRSQIIFVSAKAGEEDKVQGFSFNPNAYITKPFENNDLLLTIEKCVDCTQR